MGAFAAMHLFVESAGVGKLGAAIYRRRRTGE
jgi:hypothetical protein